MVAAAFMFHMILALFLLFIVDGVGVAAVIVGAPAGDAIVVVAGVACVARREVPQFQGPETPDVRVSLPVVLIARSSLQYRHL